MHFTAIVRLRYKAIFSFLLVRCARHRARYAGVLAKRSLLKNIYFNDIRRAYSDSCAYIKCH